MKRGALLSIVVAVVGCGHDSGPPPPPTPTANGTLGPWTAGPPLPVPRANHASAVLGNDLLVIGGNYRPVAGGPFVKLDQIHAAAIGADGALGAWREVGRLPSPVSECTAATWHDTLLVVDGLYDDDTKDGQVWAATRAADGSLGAFTSMGKLPAGLRAVAAESWVVGDTLLVASGRLPPDGDTELLLSAPLGATPLVWTTQTIVPAPGWRGQPQYLFTGNAVHVLGGYLSGTTQVVADTAWARFAAGVATPAGHGPPLPAPTAAGEAIAVDGFGFLVGGKPMINGSMGQPTVDVAAIAADGSLGAWAASTPLPVGRTNHDLALGPTHLYLTGGSVSGGGLDTVFMAQVRFLPP